MFHRRYICPLHPRVSRWCTRRLEYPCHWNSLVANYKLWTTGQLEIMNCRKAFLRHSCTRWEFFFDWKQSKQYKRTTLWKLHMRISRKIENNSQLRFFNFCATQLMSCYLAPHYMRPHKSCRSSEGRELLLTRPGFILSRFSCLFSELISTCSALID